MAPLHQFTFFVERAKMKDSSLRMHPPKSHPNFQSIPRNPEKVARHETIFKALHDFAFSGTIIYNEFEQLSREIDEAIRKSEQQPMIELPPEPPGA